jgi:LSD1 subclass zinc finger protein
MDCPSCGRPLAQGAKCVYCAHGNTFQRKETLTIPEGTVGGHRKAPLRWGRLAFILILAGAVAACFLHPGLNAKIRSLIGD